MPPLGKLHQHSPHPVRPAESVTATSNDDLANILPKEVITGCFSGMLQGYSVID